MIREHAAFFKHFSESKFKRDIDIFNDAIDNIDLFRLTCPHCKAKGRCKAFSSYSRMMVSIEDHTVITHWVTIPRVKCISCKHTHAILPSVLIPFGIYSLIFILTVLRTYYQNKFRVQQIYDMYEITHSTLYLWIGMLKRHKSMWLGVLKDSTREIWNKRSRHFLSPTAVLLCKTLQFMTPHDSLFDLRITFT